MCPYYMMYGMTYDEFWHESIDRFEAYWQANQFSIERRNQELWLQGIYIRDAVACTLSKKAKYPEKPHRLTELTDAEKEEENKQKVERFRAALTERMNKWKAKSKGADAV